MDYFRGRSLVVATMHGKEQVIAPILERSLGVKVLSEPCLDTDQFGTFDGEVTRTRSPLDCARAKCELAIQVTGADLAIASEGSFGPHPELFFAPADHELLLFIDRKNGIECSERLLSTQTNFSSRIVKDFEHLLHFADQVGFPSHALILKNSDLSLVKKGLQTIEGLRAAFEELNSMAAPIQAETDMRALYNPTRMSVIKELTAKLAQTIQHQCPSCGFPAFQKTSVQFGLPCSLCSFPTRSVLSYTYSCASCAFVEERSFPNQKRVEDPAYCDCCNP